MDIYLILFGTLEVEAYANLKLSTKKVKSTTWYENEPQRLSFTVYGNNNQSANNEWEEHADWAFQRLQLAMRTPENNYKGISNTIVKLSKNGSVIFTGYVSVTQSELDEDIQRADFVCYDVLKIVSLLSDEYVPYGTYTLGNFLNNTWYNNEPGFDITSVLSSKGFGDIQLSFSGNLINSQVTQYLFNYVILMWQSEFGLLKGFYTHTDSLPGYDREINHLFYVIFQVYASGSQIVKNVKVIEIVNGYCWIDPTYGGYDNFYDNYDIQQYGSSAEATVDIDNQIGIEIAAINDSIPRWGDSWFELQGISDNAIVFGGYTYELIDGINVNKRIEATGNIFPGTLFIGDNSTQHSPTIVYGSDPIYSTSSWIAVLKDFLIGNNLVMKATSTGNIEIKNITSQLPIDISGSKFSKKKKIRVTTKFTGLGTLDGDTTEMVDNFEVYYRNYLNALAEYKISLNPATIHHIVRDIDVLDTLTEDGSNYLILQLYYDRDSNKYDCEAIEVT